MNIDCPHCKETMTVDSAAQQVTARRHMADHVATGQEMVREIERYLAYEASA